MLNKKEVWAFDYILVIHIFETFSILWLQYHDSAEKAVGYCFFHLLKKLFMTNCTSQAEKHPRPRLRLCEPSLLGESNSIYNKVNHMHL